MRLGSNPKKMEKLQADKKHQVIVPVHIPNFEGYYKDSYKILDLCLVSINKTCHDETFLTVVNNGSHGEIALYLQEQFQEGKIHELIHTDKIGKNNAILKALKGHYFKYITVADADVLFLNGWQEETMKVFKAFPKTGVVGLTPQVRSYFYCAWNVLFDNLLSKSLAFSNVKNPGALKEFLKSIGWKGNYNKDFLRYILTIQDKKGFKAVVGSGHYVATYKRCSISHDTHFEIDELLSPKYDRELLDKPGQRNGSWRLTTEDNYAYHMGNVYEPWMSDFVNKLGSFNEERPDYNYNPLSISWLAYFIKNHLIRKLLQQRYIEFLFLRLKGLPKDVADTYNQFEK
jgi:hypothetical protein